MVTKRVKKLEKIMTHDRYRVAEVEWIQDIMPPEGTRERETVSSLKFWYECVCKVTVMLDIMLVYLNIDMHMRFFFGCMMVVMGLVLKISCKLL